MCSKSELIKRELISDYLSDYRQQNPQIKNWSALSRVTGKSERTIHRYFSKEQTPNRTSFAEILEEVGIPAEEISEHLREHYGANYRPVGYDKDILSSAAAFDAFSKSKETMIIWAFTSKKDGTDLAEIQEHMHQNIAEILINKFLELGLIREINGKYKSVVVTTRRAEALLKTSQKVAELSSSLCGVFKTGSLIQVQGLSEKGYKNLNKIKEEFEEKFCKLTTDSDNLGNMPVAFALSLCNLGVKDEK